LFVNDPDAISVPDGQSTCYYLQEPVPARQGVVGWEGQPQL
jgi:hypothetical protein